jgi:agmatine deiminase
MLTRREFLYKTAATSVTLTGLGSATAANPANQGWRMPDEGEPHRATWMAFGPDLDIWGERLHAAAQDDLARIARTIASFETVNMLVRKEDYEVAARKCGASVKLIVQPINDLWMRDSGPVFVKDAQGKMAAVNFNFNGWGNKQEHQADAMVAAFVAGRSAAPLLTSKLILEGGGIEVDGEGSAIITESCVLNANRNPGVSKAQCETELQRLLGLSKIIWLPGLAGRDITDGHTDFYARFAGPGVVLAGYDADTTSEEHGVTKRHLEILRKASDAKGRPLKVIALPGPDSVRKKFESAEFAAGYINFYACNRAVLVPEFGDKKNDSNTKSILRELFPQREIIQLNIDGIAAGGGGIHCTTQQQPA